MSADLALQRALRARLVSSPAITALVPASAILDRIAAPAPRPGIVLGEAQVVDEGQRLDRRLARVTHTVHVWVREPSREGAKAIMGAIRTALATPLVLEEGYHLADAYVASMRALSDPDGETSHGVLAVSALIEEVAS